MKAVTGIVKKVKQSLDHSHVAPEMYLKWQARQSSGLHRPHDYLETGGLVGSKVV